MSLFKGFIQGLMKSFNGKDYLRELNKCDTCGKDSFFASCLKCEVDRAYRGWEKHDN